MRADTLSIGVPLMNLEATRGDVLSRMGEEKAAERAFAAKIRCFPCEPGRPRPSGRMS